MSLNGLDDAKVTEAYQGALAEGGGWFLLKYASRDAVEVLARGTGGAAEARGAVAQYDEKSPLYGFLLYRRRKVLIKYVPEGTSRLLQARVAVHFTAVSDKFPHDTVVPITSADELSDSALASACSLHTAAPSNCSSSSSSRRKLDEITEDAEEGQGASDDTISVARPSTAASSKATITGLSPSESKSTAQMSDPPAQPELPSLTTTLSSSKSAEDPKSAISHVTVETVSEAPASEFKVENYRDSLKGYDALFEHGPDPRLSSQTARPAVSDLYAEIYAQYNKPKVKLGPRPRPSLDTKRPHTSGNGAQAAARPVSTLPANIRLANRKTAEPKRPKSRDTSVVPSIAFPPPPPVPAIPDLPPPSPSYPPKSPASVRSMPIHGHGSHKDRITPEKQRLLKALELRKKQLKARQERDELEKNSIAEDTEAGAELRSEEVPLEDSKLEASRGENLEIEGSKIEDVKGEDSKPDEAPELAEQTPSGAAIEEKDAKPVEEPQTDVLAPTLEADQNTTDLSAPSLTPEGTTADLTNSQTEIDDLHSTASACSPTSAQTQGSSCAPSTRPSSVSEDDKTFEQQAKTDDSIVERTLDTETAPQSPQQADEEDSIDSSPTVVPESVTPVPTVEITAQQDSDSATGTPASVSDDALLRRNKRESMILMPPDQQDKRRSKRESMIFLPSDDPSRLGEAASKREKRESMIFNSSKRQSFVEGKGKRRAMVDPINLHLSAENSEAEYLSDDSFMEELRSATVQEAKPVSVSKSPITPFFPRKSSAGEKTSPERSVSQQYRVGRFSPEQPLPRKSSGPWPPHALSHANSDSAVVAKKINVSSGISQRIKALAEKSNRDSSASVSPLATPNASASVLQRKSSFFATPPSGNSPSAQPIRRLSHASFANLSTTSTPDRKSVLQPPPSREGPPVYNVQHAFRKPETVQVTARIVRDGRAQKPTLTMPDENTPLDLHQSQITINHQKTIQPMQPIQTIQPTPKSPTKSRMEPTSPRPPSSSHSKEQNTALPRSSSESSWRSFGRRLSESRTEARGPRSLSAHSFESTEEKREEKKEKKDSRTSKLFKRMSSISSISRKNSAVNSLQEEDLQSTSLPSLREPPPAVQVGDLNVQFPDTLLWKRRWVEIDAAGNLVLSLSKSNEQSKGITKRYHLNDFRTPYAPDQDRQELPNSVILDFIDGRTLQCACETYIAQAQILQILREAHDAWIAYSQGA